MINITKTIRTYLLANAELQALVGENIYPVTIKQKNPESTTFDNLPQIVIERNINVNPNRDFRQYNTTVDVNILTTNYADNVTISKKVDEVLLTIIGTDGIRDVELMSVNETYISNAFIQKLTYVINN